MTAPFAWVRAATVLLFACVITACDPDPSRAFLMFDAGAPVEVRVPELPSGAGSAVDWKVGPPIPLHEVGQIFAARVWEDTLVGIADPMACQAHLYRLRSAEEAVFFASFGRCGDGPGEFRTVTDVHMHGDSVLVADEQRNALTLFPLSGGEPRTLRLVPPPEDPWLIMEILGVREDTVMLLGGLGAEARPDAGLLRRVDRESGDFIEELLPDAPAAARNQAPALRRTFVCLDPSSVRLVAANRWRVERAVLDTRGMVLAGPLISFLEWVSEEPFPDRPGMRPTAFVRIACGGGSALIQWRTQGEDREVDHYYLEVVDLDGRVLHQEIGRRPPRDHPAAMSIAGRAGEGWLAFSNRSDLGPVLRVINRPE